MPSCADRLSAEGSGSRIGTRDIADAGDLPISTMSAASSRIRLRLGWLARALRLVALGLVALGLVRGLVLCLVLAADDRPPACPRERPAPAGAIPEIGGGRVEPAGGARAAVGASEPVAHIVVPAARPELGLDGVDDPGAARALVEQ